MVDLIIGELFIDVAIFVVSKLWFSFMVCFVDVCM